jgi:hypothetical protein
MSLCRERVISISFTFCVVSSHTGIGLERYTPGILSSEVLSLLFRARNIFPGLTPNFLYTSELLGVEMEVRYLLCLFLYAVLNSRAIRSRYLSKTG